MTQPTSDDGARAPLGWGLGCVAVFAVAIGLACGDASPADPTDARVDPLDARPMPTCGNGIREEGEFCDGADHDVNACDVFGISMGRLQCSAQCSIVGSSCTGCGDGVVDWLDEPYYRMEVCDGSNLGGETCASQGFFAGDLACTAGCDGFETSACVDSICGNGTIEGAEVCDGANLAGETCLGRGYLGGNLACTADCGTLDESGCASTWWGEDFEGGAALGPEWVLGGNATWFGSAASVHAGMYAGECGNIADSQTSYLEVTLNFLQPGTVQFWYRVSTETSWDFLRFYVDGVLQTQWSGNLAWAQSTAYNIAAGQHTLRWTYLKDGSVSSYTDTVWVDDIVTTGAILP